MKPTGKLTRTLVLLKPDAIKRGLAGEIIKRFERKGLNLVASEMRWIDQKLASDHYAEHKGNDGYFTAMTDALTCGPLMAIVLEGHSAVEASRQLIGAQSPIYHSTVGTIRADLSIEEPFNLVHGSDSDVSAAREIKLWFGPSLTKVSQPKPVVPPIDLPKPPKLPKKVSGSEFSIDPASLEKFKSDMLYAINDSLPLDVKNSVWNEIISIGTNNPNTMAVVKGTT